MRFTFYSAIIVAALSAGASAALNNDEAEIQHYAELAAEDMNDDEKAIFLSQLNLEIDA